MGSTFSLSQAIIFIQIIVYASSRKTLPVEKRNLRYTAEIDASHIQAFTTKLIWSGHRQHLLDLLAEEETELATTEKRTPKQITDASLEEFKSRYHTPGRKLLANIISEVLVDAILRSLVERMPLLEGNFVMKHKDIWDDLKPICEAVAYKESEQRKEKVECHLDFMSIQNVLGISLSFSLSMQSKLAAEMSQDVIDDILDQKQVPQLVHKSVISTKAVLTIPIDFGKEFDHYNEPTMVRTERRFFDKANQLLLVTKPNTNVGKSIFFELNVLEEDEKAPFFQSYCPPGLPCTDEAATNHEHDEEYIMEHDYHVDDAEMSSLPSSEENENVFDEEQYYDSLTEDELLLQEEELLRKEEEELFEGIDDAPHNEMEEEDDVSIDTFMKQVADESYRNDTDYNAYGQSDEL